VDNLNKTIQSISLYVVAILLISITLFGSVAKADVTTGLMVAGLTFEDENISAEKPFNFTIHVLEVEAENGESGNLGKSEPASDAMVSVKFTKNNIKKELTLDEGKEGEYIGTVTLPIEGEWEIVAIAESKNGQGITDETQNVFTTTFDVDEAQTESTLIWKLLLIVGSILILIWTLKRLEPKLKQIQKKKPRV
jgi:hypothetical protein